MVETVITIAGTLFILATLLGSSRRETHVIVTLLTAAVTIAMHVALASLSWVLFFLGAAIATFLAAFRKWSLDE